jgi:hypothetical protein
VSYHKTRNGGEEQTHKRRGLVVGDEAGFLKLVENAQESLKERRSREGVSCVCALQKKEEEEEEQEYCTFCDEEKGGCTDTDLGGEWR